MKQPRTLSPKAQSIVDALKSGPLLVNQIGKAIGDSDMHRLRQNLRHLKQLGVLDCSREVSESGKEGLVYAIAGQQLVMSGRMEQGARNRQAVLNHLNARPGSTTNIVSAATGIEISTVALILRTMAGLGAFKKLETVNGHIHGRWWAMVQDQAAIAEACIERKQEELRQRQIRRNGETQVKMPTEKEPWRTVYLMDRADPERYKNQRGQGASISPGLGRSVLSGNEE